MRDEADGGCEVGVGVRAGGGDGNGGSLKNGRKWENFGCGGGWLRGEWGGGCVGGSGVEGSVFGGDGGVGSLGVDAALRFCVIPYDGGGRRRGQKCWMPSHTRGMMCVTFKIHKPCCCPCSRFFTIVEVGVYYWFQLVAEKTEWLQQSKPTPKYLNIN